MVSAEAVLNPVVTTANGGVGRTEVILGDPTGFMSGQLLLLHQTQGMDAGHFELHRIDSVDGDVAIVSPPLTGAFGTGAGSVAQAIVVPQYARLTVNSGGRVIAPVWDGMRGGVVAIAATGAVTVEMGGSIDVTGRGFRPGVSTDSSFSNRPGTQGEGELGLGMLLPAANGTGGGGGAYGACNRSSGGGGGAGGSAGGDGVGMCSAPATGGVPAGGDASPMLGGGGGSGGPFRRSAGGAGGGIIIIFAESLVVEGMILAGGNGGAPAQAFFTTCGGGGGGGGGGSIFVDVETATLGESLVTAVGGPPGPPLGGSTCTGLTAGGGGAGRISVRATTLMGTTDPPAITP
jgi:hypothetical protein